MQFGDTGKNEVRESALPDHGDTAEVYKNMRKA